MATATEKVTPKDIWDELEAQGASSVQAAGIMGNAIAESTLDPESKALDSNGAYSYGLWQFNADSYPQASSLVTGNPAKDMKAQVKFLFSVGGLKAATGNSPGQVASNFATSFERCATCAKGEASNSARQGYASQVAGWASNGNWPASAGSASDNAALTTAAAQEQAGSCAWGLNLDPLPSWVPVIGGPGNVCLLSKGQARALVSAGILIGGIGLAAFAVLTLLGTTSTGKQLAGTATRALGAAAVVAPK